MKLKNFTKVFLMFIMVIPEVVLGAAATTTTNAGCSNSSIQLGLGHIFDYVTCVLSGNVIPLLITIAVIAFIWGIIQMFIDPTNEEAKKKGKMYAVWGIIGLFVIISIWGLVKIFANTFGVETFIPQLSNQ